MSVLMQDRAPASGWESVVEEFIGSASSWARVDWSQIPDATADLAYIGLKDAIDSTHEGEVLVLRQGEDVWLQLAPAPDASVAWIAENAGLDAVVAAVIEAKKNPPVLEPPVELPMEPK